MVHFLFQRFWQLLISLFGITLLTFAIIHLAPGDPTDLQPTLHPKVSAQVKENLRRLYGLDKPLHIQYLDWLRRFVTLDLGSSFVDGEPVSQKILGRMPITVTIAILIGILVGALAGFYAGTIDAVLMRLVDILLAIPASGFSRRRQAGGAS